MIKRENMLNYEKAKVPMFDGEEEN